MEEILTNLLQFVGQAWWVEIVTEAPRCTYYFGPFSSAKDAEAARGGYVEDLEQEGAQGIKVNVKRCKPTTLTIYDEEGEFNSQKASPVLSGRL